MTRAPGSIDNELHKSEKNLERNNAVLHFPLVLPIAGDHTRRVHKGKTGERSRYVFHANFNGLSCHKSLLGVPTLLFIGLISLITAVIRFENYAIQSLEAKYSRFLLRIIPAFSN